MAKEKGSERCTRKHEESSCQLAFVTKLKGSIISPASSVPQDTARNPQHLQRDLVFQPQCSCSSLKLLFCSQKQSYFSVDCGKKVEK